VNAVFTAQSDMPSGARFRERLRAQTAATGRDPDHIRVLPGLSFLLASTEAEARAKYDRLEATASSEFRWRNLANLAGLDLTTIDPDARFPPESLNNAPKTSIGASIYRLAKAEPTTFRNLAIKISALPGGLDYSGTPEGMADLITQWFDAGACDGFTLMPSILPGELEIFVDHVVPILQRRGVARREYLGTTLRDHVGLPRPRVPWTVR
jgi:N-acetyl-S-(2-succino)cysteine monooxygenase